MKVSDLIERLAFLPPDAEVWLVYDGGARITADHVWQTNDGRVAIADFGGSVYRDRDRPSYAPLEKDNPYWRLPRDPNAESEYD